MKKTLILLFASASLTSVIAWRLDSNLERSQELAVQNQMLAIEKTLSHELVYSKQIPHRSTLSEVLSKEGFEHQDIYKLVEAAKPYRNLAQLQAGTGYEIEREGNGDQARVLSLRFKFSAFEHLILQKQLDGEWRARFQTDKVETRLVTYGGKVTSSLWDSATEAEMDPNLIVSLAEIFAWQVDFAREVHGGDRWRLSVEEKVVRGKRVGWGRILAAEYENAGRMFSAVLHQADGKSLGYFAADGSSLRRMFLRSPLKFGRITSGFSRKRFHPILKINRPHLGVDYGAPIGTPIMVVGDGRVVSVSHSAGAGNKIAIRHNATYSTAYLHLSRFAKGMHAGSQVRQGEIIGYVGMTGLATGPHLHFEFYVNNQYTDPLSIKFPSADPIKKTDLQQFLARSTMLMQTLPSWNQLDVHSVGPSLVAQEISKRVLLNLAPAETRE